MCVLCCAVLCCAVSPAAPRLCDGCQLACHGACYVRAYGQPLAAGAAAAGGGGGQSKGLDTRVLCVSCQDPDLQTLQVRVCLIDSFFHVHCCTPPALMCSTRDK